MTTEITLFHLSAGARVHVRAANLRENDAGQHGVPETEGKRAARFEHAADRRAKYLDLRMESMNRQLNRNFGKINGRN